jgi:hypothetical protein
VDAKHQLVVKSLPNKAIWKDIKDARSDWALSFAPFSRPRRPHSTIQYPSQFPSFSFFVPVFFFPSHFTFLSLSFSLFFPLLGQLWIFFQTSSNYANITSPHVTDSRIFWELGLHTSNTREKFTTPPPALAPQSPLSLYILLPVGDAITAYRWNWTCLWKGLPSKSWVVGEWQASCCGLNDALSMTAPFLRSGQNCPSVSGEWWVPRYCKKCEKQKRG